MKSPISILTWLCLLFLASCISNKKTSLEAFKQDVPSVIVVPVDYSENMKLTEHLKQVYAQK